jgi:hypothetical protein
VSERERDRIRIRRRRKKPRKRVNEMKAVNYAKRKANFLRHKTE